ncbi:protein translocase subunit SecD [Calothrix sp. UHCC 0171]|uniref:protein translocase subunit SecD n=1 Tax=Calothrix sp. UHCC 0171 TaxID=3110245 RepID=UPI002B1F5F02|nr:protein translocase subunit SecD [Calothrix sp. UHCC 0171]MEA5573814.1 protein translocase subunit SecD [Calothrix sp. UHCC 0171]
MQKQRSLLALILVMVIAAIAVIATPGLRVPLGLDLQGGSQLTIQLKPTKDIPKITERNLEDVLQVVELRVNGLGVAEAVIQKAGEDKILVQLPGVKDPEQAERVLGGTAQLEFKKQKAGTEAKFFELVTPYNLLKEQLKTARKAKDQAAIDKIQADIQKSNQEIGELFESTNPPLIGKFLQDAQGAPTQGQNWEVNIRFDKQGGELFAQLSKEVAGTGRTTGIFLDNAIISYPTVRPEYAATGITGGNVSISGNFDAQEAIDLGVQLRGGALPVPVEIVENRTVGATLGQDSIQSSIYAGIGGLALVLIYMIVYYRLPGVLADISLIIYALFSWAAFGLLQVTMTLPGIAGFVLSIGMAVDANVLIFERTREELRAGKTLFRSVESGFYRAFSSILDGNVTTWVACFFLFIFGSGLVKGFAVTLSIGVAISMFTAITASRTLMFIAIAIPAFKKPEYFCPNLSASKSKKPEVAQ